MARLQSQLCPFGKQRTAQLGAWLGALASSAYGPPHPQRVRGKPWHLTQRLSFSLLAPGWRAPAIMMILLSVLFTACMKLLACLKQRRPQVTILIPATRSEGQHPAC